MKKPTFREQYNKIVNAYMDNQLKPLSACACFIGNLLNNNGDWAQGRRFATGYHDPYLLESDKSVECLLKEGNGLYTIEEIVALEKLFLLTIGNSYNEVRRNNNEETLFKAMEVTLKALKELHESKGEIVEDYIFNKRTLELCAK